MKSSNKIKITLSVFSLASLLLAVFLIWPLLNEINKNSDDLVLAKKDIVILSAQSDEAENFKNNYELYKLSLEKIDRLFFNPDSPVDFIKFLEDTAASSQIISQISLAPSSAGSNKTSQNFVTFQFSSKGSFSETLNFAKKIETGPYLIEIVSLTIQNSEAIAVESSNDVAKNYSFRKVNAAFTIAAFLRPL